MSRKNFFHKALSAVQSIIFRIQRARLGWIYEKRSHVALDPEPVNVDIVRYGKELRDTVLEKYRDKYKCKPYRFLFQIPPDGLGVIWFKDLMQTLEYAGVRCESIKQSDPDFLQAWNAFQPNVFISLDAPEVLRSLDLDFICDYKKNHGCLRFFTPITKYRFPEPGISAEDFWRLELAREGRSVDAFFSMFVNEHFACFWNEWVEVGFQHLSMPHGCNPIYHYPRQGVRDLDYFMATSFGGERVQLTWEYLSPIFKKYNGLWAGPNWGFGLGPLTSDQLPELYARAKIVPNPLARFLINYPSEITERSFSAIASGVFQITDWTPVTERFYTPDELVTVRSSVEFIEKFDYYIHRPDERERIVSNGLRRVFSEHTYFHRIDGLIQFLDQNPKLF
jgi:hypothetical protein